MILQLSVASASEIEVTMHLSNSELYKPEEVTVFIRLTNIANAKLESVELLDYLERPIVTFGKTSLEPYESIEWVGTWLVTEEQLITEKLAFTCRYSVVDSKGKTQKALRFVKPIKNNNAKKSNSFAIHQTNTKISPVLLLPNFGSGYWVANYDENYIFVEIEDSELEGSIYDNNGNQMHNSEKLFIVSISGAHQGETTICLDLMRDSFSVIHVDLSVYINENMSIAIQNIEVANN